MSKTSMQQMTVKQLQQIAKENGLKGYSRLRKDDLIEFLLDNLVSEIESCEITADEIEIVNVEFRSTVRNLKQIAGTNTVDNRKPYELPYYKEITNSVGGENYISQILDEYHTTEIDNGLYNMAVGVIQEYLYFSEISMTFGRISELAKALTISEKAFVKELNSSLHFENKEELESLYIEVTSNYIQYANYINSNLNGWIDDMIECRNSDETHFTKVLRVNHDLEFIDLYDMPTSTIITSDINFNSLFDALDCETLKATVNNINGTYSTMAVALSDGMYYLCMDEY